MAEHHERLLDELEAEGPPALRRHLRDGAQTRARFQPLTFARAGR